MKITNIHIDALNGAGNYFSLGCEYKGDRYHVWCNSNFEIDGSTLYKNPPAGVQYKAPGCFSTRYLRADSRMSAEIIAEMIHWAKKTNMLAAALAEQAEENAAKQKECDAAKLARHKEKLGPEMFTLLLRVREAVGFTSIYPELRTDISALLAKVGS